MRLLSLFLLISYSAHCQTKTNYDKIIKRDYQIIECTVTKIADRFVEYNLPNETLVYNLDVTKIAKIDFANGKSKSFLNDTPTPVNTNPTSTNPDILTYQGVYDEQVIHENTLAILPVPFDNNNTQGSSESMAKLAQNDIYSNLLDKHAYIYPLTIQDLRTTNSLLRKANINFRNVDEVSISDLQKILGVDNIIALKVSYTIDETHNTTVQNSESKLAIENVLIGDDFTSVNNSVDKFYDFMVYFDIYKKGQKVYSKSRKPFFSDKDSWIDAVNYLFKRSPLYKE